MRGRPIFHEQTQADFERLAARMPHALGLYGERGIGLLTAATFLASRASAQATIVYPEKNEKVDLENGSITIEIIRRLYTVTQGRSNERRCIIVTAADSMSAAAQNAFLKLLEEPTHNTTFILLTHQPTRLLETVRSRLQMQHIRQITVDQSDLLLDRLGVEDATRRQQLLFIAKGLPARLARLASDEAYFEAEVALLRQARAFIQGSIYERLLIANTLRSSRKDATSLVGYAMAIIRHDMTVKQHADDEAVQLLDRLVTALERLDKNGNPRLVLAQVVLR